MGTARQRLSLDRPVAYEIVVPGRLNENWLEWNAGIILRVEGDDEWMVTTLTGTIDQAMLQGLLHRLYATGLPLISVICLDYSSEEDRLDMAQDV